MAIDVGDITGGITVETAGLRKALAELSQFSAAVNHWAASTEEGAAKVTAALARQERAVASAVVKANSLQQAMRRASAPPEMLSTVTRQLQAFTKVMTEAELDSIEFGRAQAQMAAQLERSNQALKNHVATQRDLERVQRANTQRAEIQQRRDMELRTTALREAARTQEQQERRDMELQRQRWATNANQRRIIESRDLDLQQRRWAEASRQRRIMEDRDMELHRNRLRQREIMERRDMQLQEARWAEEARRRRIMERRDEQLFVMRGGSLRGTAGTGAQRFDPTSVNRYAGAMRNLERATILAAGPLSGVGARVSVLASLMEEGTLKATLFIAGITGAVVGFGLFAASGVRASMQMEKFNALLGTAAGATVLAGQEFEYIRQTADRFGASVKDIVPNYAKFAAASRLSGISLEDTRNVFEAIITTSTALRSSGEETGRMFLALEQIMNKGTVQSEEIKRQLGDVLPAALQIAAQSMGVTSGKFIEMMEKGQLLSKNFVGPFANLLKQIFGPAAEVASSSLQAELNKLSNATFEMTKAFDEAVRGSQVFANIVRNLADGMKYLTANMSEVIGVLGAVAAALAVWAAPTAIMAGIGALVAIFTKLRTAIVAVGAVGLTALGGLPALLLRVGLAAGGAVLGYKYFSQAADTAAKSQEDFKRDIESHVTTMERIGTVHEAATKRVVAEVRKRIEAMRLEAQALEKTAQIKPEENAGIGMLGRQIKERFLNSFGMATEQQQARRNINAIKGNIDEFEGLIARLNAIPVTPGTGGETDPTGGNNKTAGAIENVAENIAEQLRKIKSLRDQVTATGQGVGEVQWAKALGEAMDLLSKLPQNVDPDKVLKPMSAALKQAGFDGENITVQLTQAILAGEKLQDTVSEYLTRARGIPQAIEEAKDKIQDLRSRFEDIESVSLAPIDLTKMRIRNPDGSISTERTITVEVDAKYHLIPTIVKGQQLSDDEAIEQWKRGLNNAVGTFNTELEATQAAMARSAAKTNFLAGLGLHPQDVREIQKRAKVIEEFKDKLQQSLVPSEQIGQLVREFTDAFDKIKVAEKRAEIGRELEDVIARQDPVSIVELKYERYRQVVDEAYRLGIIPTVEQYLKELNTLEMGHTEAIVRAYEQLTGRIMDTVQQRQQALGNTLQRVDISRQTGQISSLEALRQKAAAAGEAAQGLKIDLEALQDLQSAAKTPEAKQKIGQQIDNMQTAIKQLEADAKAVEQIFDQIGENALSTFFEDVITGTKSVSEAFRDMANNIFREVSKLAAQDIASQIFGGGSGGKGIGLGSLLGPIFGASAKKGSTSAADAEDAFAGAAMRSLTGAGSGKDGGGLFGGIGDLFSKGFGFLTSFLPGFGGGGHATGGAPIMVGEHGREVFVPDQSGTIVPSGLASSMMGAPIINITIQGNPDRRSIGQVSDAAYQGMMRYHRKNG